MANQKTYKFLMEIAGKIDGSFDSSLGGATGKMGKLQGMVAKFGKMAAGAFVAKEVIQFGASCVQSAMDFEDSMADVSKVVDGLRDSNGKNTKEYYKMADSLQNLSLKIPLTANELAQITAAAGQAGVARKDLTLFTEDAAKMATAFDVTAEQSGDWMAQWRTGLGLTQKQVEKLGDQINYLDNTSSERASKISAVVSDVGSLGKIAGLSAGQVAALAAATTGVDASTAGTGIKSLITSMAAGSSATAKQQKVLKRLGLTSAGVAKSMQKDSEGTILKFMKSINKLPKAERTAAIKDYFGKQSLQTIAKFSGKDGLENLTKQFKNAGDASKYNGSMQKEFDIRSKTTSNSLKLMKNSLDYVKITIGSALLPIVVKGAQGLAKVFQMIGKGLKALKTILKPFSVSVKRSFYNFINQKAKAGSSLGDLLNNFKRFYNFIYPTLRLLGKATLTLGKIFVAVFKSRIGSAIKIGLSTIITVANSMFKIFFGIIDFLTGVFTGDWKRVWKGIVEIFKGVFGGIVAIAKVPINALISLVNGMIAGLNTLKIKIPKFVPKFGGKTVGFNISSIPYLAKGGIVTAPTLAMIGEAGPEKVIPLNKDDGGGGMNITFAPVINIDGSASRKDVEGAMSTAYEEFVKLMNKYEREKKRKKFA